MGAISQVVLPALLTTSEHFKELPNQSPWVRDLGLTIVAGLDFGATHASIVFDTPRDRSGKKVAGTSYLARFVVEPLPKLFRIPTKVAIVPNSHRASLRGLHGCSMIFGTDVDQALSSGTIKSWMATELLKLIFHSEYPVSEDDPSFDTSDPLLQKAMKDHTRFCKIIREQHGGKVTIRDPLTGMVSEMRINDMDDVVQAYLNFVWRSARMKFASFIGINVDRPSRRDQASIAGIKRIFRDETQVATSVPAIWTETTMDRFQAILSRAGFPTSTVIQSEAVAATTYHFNQASLLGLGGTGTEDFLCLDVGGYTLDGAGVRRVYRNGRAKIVQTVPAMSAFDGILKIKAILERIVKEKAGTEFEGFLKSMGMDQETFVDRVCRAFEFASRKFDNNNTEMSVRFCYKDSLRLSRLLMPQNLIGLMTFSAEEVSFGRQLFEEVFDEWLERVLDFILALIEAYRKTCPHGTPLLGLSGHGSLAPIILPKIRTLLARVQAGVRIDGVEDRNRPSVAHGNFIGLTRSDCLLDRRARTSYGIRHDIHEDTLSDNDLFFGELYRDKSTDEVLLDRVFWVVERGTPLSLANANLVTEGTKTFQVEHTVNKSRYPIVWPIKLVVSGHDGMIGKDRYQLFQKAEAAGHVEQVLEVEMVITAADCKMKAIRNGQQLSTLECKFRARVCLNKLQPRLVISIPKNGKFVKPISPEWRENSEPCQSIEIPLLHLCSHATTQ